MKGQFRGFSGIFSFTFTQHTRSKGYKNSTITVALLCLLLPALIMTGIEYFSEGKPTAETEGVHEEQTMSLEGLEQIMAVDLSSEKEVDLLSLEAGVNKLSGMNIEVTDMGSDFDGARKSAAGSNDVLIMVIEQQGASYTANIVMPDDSLLPEEAAYGFQSLFDQYWYAATAADEKDMGEGGFDDIDDVVAMVVSYINIMLLYFFVLAYGQGVANSVVMEKSSKLMESFLVAVKPAAIVLGKLLAITATGIIQLLSWLVSLFISFMAGTAIVKAMNPETDMFIIKGFEMLKSMLDGLFSPVNCIMAVLMIVAGMLLYCALAGIGGALASKTEDLSSANVIFTLILVVSFFGALAGGGLDPGSSSTWLDWIPFTSVMITPGRILMGSLPLWQSMCCLAITLITALAATWIAGKVYKAMALYKGDVPKPADIIKILKNA